MDKLDENAFDNHTLCLVKVSVAQQGGSSLRYTLPAWTITEFPKNKTAIVFFKNVIEHKKKKITVLNWDITSISLLTSRFLKCVQKM